MDIRERVDKFLEAEKTIVGTPLWEIGTRSEMRVMKRAILANGETSDAYIHSQAYPFTRLKEYRHLLVFEGECISRLDFASEIDGLHFNGFNCPAACVIGKVDPLHYHSWESNKHFANARSLPNSLLCASNVADRIDDIDQGFRWFCDDNNIIATSGDVPGWPPVDRLL